MAHEIGHYRLNHIPKTFPLSGLQMLAALAFVQYVGGSDTVLGWAGVSSLGDPAAVPVFSIALGVPMAVLGLLSAWVSRRNEREADLEALELLGDPTSFVHMWPAFVELNKADLEPGWWDKLNASHPEVAERMQFGLDWAADERRRRHAAWGSSRAGCARRERQRPGDARVTNSSVPTWGLPAATQERGSPDVRGRGGGRGRW